MTVAAVTDTGPLIPLAEVGALDLLSVFERLVVPETVRAELQAGVPPDGLADLEYATVAASDDALETGDLDPGEAAALAVARERDAVLLTDDLAARKRASTEDVEVHGSIGVVALGCSRGRLDRDQAASLMRALQRETSLFVSSSVVERGIDLCTKTETTLLTRPSGRSNSSPVALETHRSGCDRGVRHLVECEAGGGASETLTAGEIPDRGVLRGFEV